MVVEESHLLVRKDAVGSTDRANFYALCAIAWELLISHPENAKNTICRNITIYGHCRYEREGKKRR